MPQRIRTTVASMIVVGTLASATTGAPFTVPAGFEMETVASGLTKPTGMAVAPDGRIFVMLQSGLVRVVQDNVLLPDPFIDLQDEVGFGVDRGLLGIALAPDFERSRNIYLLYVVDPVFGRPDEVATTPAFGRLVRYTGTEASGGNVADLDSRVVLLGNGPEDGIPCCFNSHSMGDLEFGTDGALFLSTGDGANWISADDGGDPLCAALFGEEQDIGAFRAQRLDCLAGKILRIDPTTGQGLPDNPFFTGDPDAARSKVWASGLRNPFRLARRPGTNDLFVADVGWTLREEISVCSGGENFGWPCVEGLVPPPSYPSLTPPSNGCDTLETPDNPGPVTAPLVQWHHSNPDLSQPPGITGACAIAGAFYDSTSFPPSFQGAMFIADHIQSWIRVLKLAPDGSLGEIVNFASVAERPVDIAVDPTTGDVLVLSNLSAKLRRIRYVGSDLDGNGVVDGGDLGILLSAWGQPGGAADLDGNGTVDGADLGIMLSNWG